MRYFRFTTSYLQLSRVIKHHGKRVKRMEKTHAKQYICECKYHLQLQR